MQWNNNQKNQAIWQFLNDKHIDIFLTTENNVAWHCITTTQQLLEWTRGWWEASQLSIGHNKQDPSANPYQLEGVAILSCNRAAHGVAGSEQDYTRLGWFCWTTYQGKNNLILQIISGYQLCNSDNGHLSVLQQHWQYLDQYQPDNKAHPCNLFWTDLRTILQQWMDQGDQIIMGIDANKDIQHPDITTFYDEFGMTKILIAKHRQEAPPTQNHGSHPINGLFATRAIQNSQCRYLSGLDVIGDHRCLWIDIPETCIFRTTMSVPQAPKARWLKTEDLWIVKNTWTTRKTTSQDTI